MKIQGAGGFDPRSVQPGGLDAVQSGEGSALAGKAAGSDKAGREGAGEARRSEPKDTVELGRAPAGKDADGAVKPHAKWLFINYVAGDCNLTEDQLKNLDQQERVGSDKNTHIVAYVDVGPKDDPFGQGWQNCRTLYITKDQTANKLNSEVVADNGRVDMSNPKTLSKFVIDAIKKFPADHVALVLNDHGGGFTGAMADDSDGNFMSVPQIKQALADAQAVTGKKLDILGFDACLMAETEVAHEMKDYADILLASEESEGGPGWTYDSMLGGKNMGEAISRLQTSLKSKINVDPEAFSKIVVDVNRNHSDDIPTFSATHLNKMDKVTQSVNELALAIKKTSDKDAVRQAIEKAENYGGGWLPYRDIHDLYGLTTRLAAQTQDPELKKAAEAVAAQVKEAVFANESDPAKHPESYGLSIYAPLSNTGELGYNYKDLQFAKDTQWDEAIISLGKQQPGAAETTPRAWPDGTPRSPKPTP